MDKQKIFDERSDLIFPRLYNRENKIYLYPVFSELGITYEPKNMKSHEEIVPIQEALKWHFVFDDPRNAHMEFIYDLDKSAMLYDKNEIRLYEHDIITDIYGKRYILKYNIETFRWEVELIVFSNSKDNEVEQTIPLLDFVKTHKTFIRTGDDRE